MVLYVKSTCFQARVQTAYCEAYKAHLLCR